VAKRVKVAIIYGGKSGEHEVSLISAASVYHHLDRAHYEVVAIGMDKEGRFHLHLDNALEDCGDTLPVKSEHSKEIPSLTHQGKFVINADVVFPIAHGPLYEDGCLQGLLKLSNIAVVGCDVMASAMAMDKDMARRIACIDGLKSTRYRVISWHATDDVKTKICKQAADEFGWPLFVKPCSLGSSVGIYKVDNINELLAAIKDALRFDESVLIEAFVDGHEIELAVLENPNPSLSPKVSVAGEISTLHQDNFYSYAAKYIDTQGLALVIPAELDGKTLDQLQKYAGLVFQRLKCRGMARVDFFIDKKTGEIIFNELNTIPGFTSVSMYPKLWCASGLTYGALLDELVQLALTHHRCQQHLVTNYQ